MKKSKTKKFKVVNGRTLIVTADMGKDRHFGYWRCPDGTDVKPFAFWNNGRGFQEPRSILKLYIFYTYRANANHPYGFFLLGSIQF